MPFWPGTEADREHQLVAGAYHSFSMYLRTVHHLALERTVSAGTGPRPNKGRIVGLRRYAEV
jgi:hypothetical protein